MIYNESVNLAMKIAYKAHSGQVDKNGIPYIFHPIHLAEQMNSDEEVVVALLHDVLEDTFVTKELLSAYFSNNIIDAVVALTHKKDENYFDYIRRVKQNKLARIVKIADLKHNADISRIAYPTTVDEKRIQKYRQAIKILERAEKHES